MNNIKISHQSDISIEQKRLVLQLWNDEYPKKLNYLNILDFDSYLNNLLQKTHYLFETNTGEVLAWALSFTRDSERWFVLLVNSKSQRKGFGSQILNQIKHDENSISGWVIDHDDDLKKDGNKYNSPLKFYLKNNFIVVDQCRLITEKINAVKVTWNSNFI